MSHHVVLKRCQPGAMTMTRTPPITPTEDPSQVSGFDSYAPLEEATLRRLYQYMLKCRTVEERIRLLFRQGRFSGNYFAAVGQEATEVGATVDLLPEDTIAPSHRNFVTHIMKGTPLKLMFAHIFLRKDSPDQGRCAQAHCGYAPLNIITPSSTIAAQLAIGTGVALANKMQKKTSVVVALSGEGSTSLGLWHESLNFAGVQHLPIVFILENNLWAESVPARLQSAVENFSVKARAYGIRGITVDGNDVVAVYKATQAAILRARQGDGPSLIECKTYRWYGHSEIDPAKYRTVEELEYWKSRDPISAMERYLQERGFWAESWKQELLAEFNKEIDEAIEFAEKSPYPEPEEALDHVFSFSIRERELNRRVWAPQI
jgi:TPP-dependent pyruvate/acetoin dehydrogenase alpha subunit